MDPASWPSEWNHLFFKPELHCLGPLTRITARNRDGITLPLLLQKGLTGEEKVGPCALFNRGKGRVCKELQERLQPCDEWRKSVLGFFHCGDLPSGMQFEDYLFYARQKLWEDGKMTLLAVMNVKSGRWWQIYMAIFLTRIQGMIIKSQRYWCHQLGFSGLIVFALMCPIVLSLESSGMEDYQCELILSSIAAPKTMEGKLCKGDCMVLARNSRPRKWRRQHQHPKYCQQEEMEREDDQTSSPKFRNRTKGRTRSIPLTQAISSQACSGWIDGRESPKD